MEKVTTVSIAATQFTLEERAYQRLDTYLSSLKQHFATDEERDEIISDIESRIAEKLLDKKHRVVTEQEIGKIIADIGEASEWDEEKTDEPSLAPRAAYKRLYRNTDDAVLGGVASGIATYFAIDPIVVRLLFIVSMFFGGSGIIVYLILWVLIPAADSASKRLEMQGQSVTLEDITRLVKNRASKTEKRSTLKNLFYFPFEVAATVMRFTTQKIFPILGRVFGVLLGLGAFAAMLGITAGISILAINWNTPCLQTIIQESSSFSLLWLVLLAAYVAALVPLLFIVALGQRLRRRKNVFSPTTGFALIGLWVLAVVLSIAGTTRIVNNYYTYTRTHADTEHVFFMQTPLCEDRHSVEKF